VDFGLSCDVTGTSDSQGALVRLFTHTLDDYRTMEPGFTPPPDVSFDANGYPVVLVPGLMA
jgi:hypothetical protein